ncbi:MAG: hypothetical protein V7721_05505 [Porticoccaceae bacterium]
MRLILLSLICIITSCATTHYNPQDNIGRYIVNTKSLESSEPLSLVVIPKSLEPSEPVNLNDPSDLSYLNPDFAKSGNISKLVFDIRGSSSALSSTSISKKIYRTAIGNADSGHAYDAFLAALAYRVGYFKMGRFDYVKNKGMDATKYIHYLNRAAELGWPEAHMYLYYCYDKVLVSNHLGFNHCRKAYDDFNNGKRSSPKGNVKQAAWHLIQAAKFGRFFDTKFNYVGSDNNKDNNLAEELELMIASHQEQAVAAQTDPNPNEPQRKRIQMFPDAENNCMAIYEKLLIRAQRYDEPNSCGENNGNHYVYSLNKAGCPGYGYWKVRSHLEACMATAKTDADWETFFFTRLDNYHAWSDKDLKIFQKGLSHYRKKNDTKKIRIVEKWMEKAERINFESAGYWEERKQQILADDRRKSQIRDAQKAKEKADIIEADRKHDEWEARNNQREAQAKREMEQDRSTYKAPVDNIERMKQEAMQDIYKNKVKLHKESSSGGRITNTESDVTRPTINKNTQVIEKDCPKGAYFKSGACDHEAK